MKTCNGKLLPVKNPTSEEPYEQPVITHTISWEQTERTKLGPGFDAVGVSTADDQDYPNDLDMEDTASSNVQVIDEVVPKMDVSLLGLTPTVPLSTESLCEVEMFHWPKILQRERLNNGFFNT